MQSIRLAYAKCYQCIKEGVDAGAGAEKDVIQFGKYSICLCEKHLNQVIGKIFEQDKQFDMSWFDSNDGRKENNKQRNDEEIDEFIAFGHEFNFAPDEWWYEYRG